MLYSTYVQNFQFLASKIEEIIAQKKCENPQYYKIGSDINISKQDLIWPFHGGIVYEGGWLKTFIQELFQDNENKPPLKIGDCVYNNSKITDPSSFTASDIIIKPLTGTLVYIPFFNSVIGWKSKDGNPNKSEITMTYAATPRFFNNAYNLYTGICLQPIDYFNNYSIENKSQSIAFPRNFAPMLPFLWQEVINKSDNSFDELIVDNIYSFNIDNHPELKINTQKQQELSIPNYTLLWR